MRLPEQRFGPDIPEQKFLGYRPLKEFELIRQDDWFVHNHGLASVSSGVMPEFMKRVLERSFIVPAWLVGSFWRHVLTEGRRVGCSHPQNPDDTIPGDWLKTMPCPVPACPAGQHGGVWHVQMPPPRISLAMALDGGPLGEYRKITYVSEPEWENGQRHFRWRLER